MEIIICTINHPKYLEDTLYTFKNNINIDLYDCRLLINIDPFPNNNTETVNEVLEIAKKYCKDVEYRVGDKFTAAAGLRWGINLLKNDYFFILGGGKTLIKMIDISYMKEKLFSDDKVVQIATLNNNDKYFNYLLLIPCLCKTSWFKNIYLKYSVDHLEIEYQVRELGILDNKKCLSYKISDSMHEYYPQSIKSYEYKNDWNCIYWNSSEDEEINKLINIHGEWHKNILEKFIKNFDGNNDIHKNFYLKSLDKEWIFRWTGFFGFIDKNRKEYYRRHTFKSRDYLCNKLSNLNFIEIQKLLEK